MSGQRYALDPERHIAILGAGDDVGQHPIALPIVGDQPTAGGVQDLGLGQHGLTRGIGAHDAAARIEQQHASADAVERVGKGRGFRGLLLDHLADERGAANVRHDQSHAPARFTVDEAVARVAKDHEGGPARRRLVQHGV